MQNCDKGVMRDESGKYEGGKKTKQYLLFKKYFPLLWPRIVAVSDTCTTSISHEHQRKVLTGCEIRSVILQTKRLNKSYHSRINTSCKFLILAGERRKKKNLDA